MRLIPLPLALLAALSLAACGGGEKPAEKGGVASLTSPSASTPATKDTTEKKQVRLRLDSSTEEANRLRDTWHACLKKNGVKFPAPGMPEEQPKAAWDECKLLFPAPPWEMDSDNPDYVANFHKVVVCMKKAGAKINEMPDGEGWTYADGNTLSPERIADIQKECERKELGGGR